jgi:DNA-binding MarR family transcriptional regulator
MNRDVADALDRLFELAVVLGGLMDRRLAEHGLTPARAEVIWLLHHSGQQLTQRELSRALRCSPRNVTGLVDALESLGFVARSPHPDDRRAVLVGLTGRGRALVTPWQSDRESGAEQLFADTTPAELTTFTTVLDRVLSLLRTQGPTDEPGEPDEPDEPDNPKGQAARPR